MADLDEKSTKRSTRPGPGKHPKSLHHAHSPKTKPKPKKPVHPHHEKTKNYPLRSNSDDMDIIMPVRHEREGEEDTFFKESKFSVTPSQTEIQKLPPPQQPRDPCCKRIFKLRRVCQLIGVCEIIYGIGFLIGEGINQAKKDRHAAYGDLTPTVDAMLFINWLLTVLYDPVLIVAATFIIRCLPLLYMIVEAMTATLLIGDIVMTAMYGQGVPARLRILLIVYSIFVLIKYLCSLIAFLFWFQIKLGMYNELTLRPSVSKKAQSYYEGRI